jgi:xylan 1,4-beta-xylosidase
MVPARRYAPPGESTDRAAPLVWLHGGAFAWGDLDMAEADAVAAAVAGTGREVVSVDYRRVPAFSWVRKLPPGRPAGVRFPVPVDDVVDVFAWVRERSVHGRVVLGGASAGACLAASAAVRFRDEGRAGPDRLVLAYGTFHAALPAPSPRACAGGIGGGSSHRAPSTR